MNGSNDNIEFIERYLIIELFEKIIRIKKFIKTAYEQDKRESDKQLLNLYRSALDFISKQIYQFCENLPKERNDGIIFENMLYISKSYSAITKIHQDLRNISSIKVPPEINTFLFEIDKSEEKLKEFNLVLTDDYSFKERNLGRKILHDLNESYQMKPNLGNTHSFILPKIEFSNPLNWSILVHEYGHVVSKNETDSYLEKFYSNGATLNPSEEQTIKNWVEEMFCDVFAAKLLGPAYLTSFISFSLLNSFECPLHSNTHPSVYLRAENIKSFLHRNKADFSNVPGITNYGSQFNSTMINIGSSCNRYSLDSTKFQLNQTRILRTFRDYISEKEGMKVHENNSNLNVTTVDRLFKLLKDGLPIGTIREQLNEETLQIIGKEPLEISSDDMAKIKKSSIERPTTHWEILNAGWIYKIEYIKNESIKLFFSDFARDINSKLNEYSKHIDKLDDILLHSISTSQIIKSIET